MTVDSVLPYGQDDDIHESADSGGPTHKKSTKSSSVSDSERDCGYLAPHTPVPHELRRALKTAKTLEEQLEVADQPVLRRIVLYVRETLLLRLRELESDTEAAGE